LVDAVGQTRDGGPRGALRAVDDRLGQRVDAVESELGHELKQLRAANVIAAGHGVQVTLDFARGTHIAPNNFPELLVALTTHEELCNRNVETFFVCLNSFR